MENEDFGIEANEMSNEIITELSPRHYLDKHGIYVSGTCGCHGGDKLGAYEIRIDPTVLSQTEAFYGIITDSDKKNDMMMELYNNILAGHFPLGKLDIEKVRKALFSTKEKEKLKEQEKSEEKPLVRLSKKNDIEEISKCENLGELTEAPSASVNNYNDAIEEGHVLRIFYLSAEVCLDAFLRMFKDMYQSIFRDTMVNYEFINLDKVIVTENFGEWVMVKDDDASDEEAPQK
jgi:hypothetical protein